MWTVDDLHRAVERRNEHLALAPEVERVILALERASGRTEEIVRRGAAREQLNQLLAVLDPGIVPDHVRDRYPVFPAGKVKALPHAPAPLPAASINKSAIIALLKSAENATNVTDTARAAQRPKEVSLEPQAAKGKTRTSGPSR